MNRHSPSRNQRSKGIKIKQILQICVLVAICLWLIYQVKHSHDKKMEFEVNDAKITLNSRRENEISKLGRKDLLPRVEEEPRTEIEKHNEEEDEIEEEKEEEIKIDEKDEHEEVTIEEKDETEEETKNEDKDGLDDEIKNEEKDEQDDEIKNEDKDEQEEEIKNEEKDEQEEETKNGEKGKEEEDEIKTEERDGEERDSGKDGIDERDEEDKETEEAEAKESELKEGEENKDVLAENEVSLVDHDRDEGNENTHEAREEQYKADDASSAVTHDDSDEKVNSEVKLLDQENKVNTTEEINTGQNGTKVELGNNQQGQNMMEVEMGDSQPGQSGTEVEMGNSQLGQNGMEVEIGNGHPAQNVTSIIMEATNAQEPNNNTVESQNSIEGTTTNGETYNLQSMDLEQGNDTNIVNDNNQLYSNLTIKDSVVFSNTATNLTSSNGYDDTENKEHSSSTDDSLESNTNQIQHGQMDSTIPLEEKEVRTYLDTLPEIRTEGTNSEYAAAE